MQYGFINLAEGLQKNLKSSFGNFYTENRLIFRRGPSSQPESTADKLKKITEEPANKEVDLEELKSKTEVIKTARTELEGRMKRLKKEPNQQLKAIFEKIKAIEDRIVQINKLRASRRENVIKDVNTQINGIAKGLLPHLDTSPRPAPVAPATAPAKAPDKKGAETKKEKPEQEKAPEKKEEIGAKHDMASNIVGESVDRIPADMKLKLQKLFENVEKKGWNIVARSEAIKLIRQMNIKPEKPNRPEFLNVGNGYMISIADWKGSYYAHRAKFVALKGNKLLFCQKEDGTFIGGKSKPMDRFEAHTIRCANDIKNRGAMQQELSRMIVEKGQYKFRDNPSLHGFKNILNNYSKITNPNVKEWTYAFPGVDAKIAYKRTSATEAVFRIKVGEQYMQYDTTKPYNLTLLDGDKKVLMNDQQFIISDKLSLAIKKRSKEKVNRKKNAEVSKQRAERGSKAKEVITNIQKMQQEETVQERKSNIDKLLPETKAKLLKDKPKLSGENYTIVVEAKDGRQRSTLNRLKIHELLDVKGELKNMVVIIKIGEKEAMYYPGQNTFYKLDRKGNQMYPADSNRIRFGIGNKIEIKAIRPPVKEDFNKLHRRARIGLQNPKQSLAEYLSSRENVKLQKNALNLLKGFIQIKGKIGDIKETPENKGLLSKLKKIKESDFQKANIAENLVKGLKIEEVKVLIKALNSVMREYASYKSLSEQAMEEADFMKKKIKLNNSLRKFSADTKVGIGFEDLNAQNDFVNTLVEMAASDQIHKLKNPILKTGDCTVVFKKLTNTEGIFTINARGLKLQFNTGNPSEIGLPNPNKAFIGSLKKQMSADVLKATGLDKVKVGEYMRWPLKQGGRNPFILSSKAALKHRAFMNERVEKEDGEKLKKIQIERGRAAGESLTELDSSISKQKENIKSEFVSKLVGDKLKKYCKIENQQDKYSLKITPNQKYKRAMRNIPLQNLMNFNKIHDKVVYVTVKDANGELKRGMYYPGQKNRCYELKGAGANEKQTWKPLKIKGAATITIEPKTPAPADLNKVQNYWKNKLSRSHLKLENIVNNGQRQQALKNAKLHLDQFMKFKGNLKNLQKTNGFDKIQKQLKDEKIILKKEDLKNPAELLRKLENGFKNKPDKLVVLLNDLSVLIRNSFVRIQKFAGPEKAAPPKTAKPAANPSK